MVSTNCPSTPRRGRPRKYSESKDRYSAYRQRRKENDALYTETRRRTVERDNKIKNGLFDEILSEIENDSALHSDVARLEQELREVTKCPWHLTPRTLTEWELDCYQRIIDLLEYYLQIEKQKRRNDLSKACLKEDGTLDCVALAPNAGAHLTDAPRGKGLLVSGGYNTGKCELIDAMRRGCET